MSGIARSSSRGLISTFTAGGVGYTHELVEYVIDANNQTAAILAQKENPETDIFTGIRFDGGSDVEITMDMVEAYLDTLPEEQSMLLL